METLSYRQKSRVRAAGSKSLAIIGVVASGNLEVLVERVLPDTQCQVDINTAAVGFGAVWEAVIADFEPVDARAHGARGPRNQVSRHGRTRTEPGAQPRTERG